MTKTELHIIYGGGIAVLIYLLYRVLIGNVTSAASSSSAAAATQALENYPAQVGNDLMNWAGNASGFNDQPGLLF